MARVCLERVVYRRKKLKLNVYSVARNYSVTTIKLVLLTEILYTNLNFSSKFARIGITEFSYFF